VALLSSKIVKRFVLSAGGKRENVRWCSPKMVHKGMRGCIAVLRAMYFASMVERVVLVWRRLPQTMGDTPRVMTKPVCDRADQGSSASSILYPPAKSASA
jgi:hypothetical protein